LTEKDSGFTKLVDYLRATRGFDFSGYKISSLVRRVQKRMAEVGVTSYDDYIDFLEVHPDEFQPLFNTVLINVTSFFRDELAWQYIAERVIPRLMEERGPERQIRVWSAGCASGEEAYTVAMLFAEALGEADFRERVKIYATDADEEALTQARQGAFGPREVESVPAALLGKYFEHAKDGRYVFRPDLRRAIIFGRHDLVQDAAIGRVDLLICRNTLMYFNLETQAKILARFHFALNGDGYIFLGKAETLLAHGQSFRPVDLKRRVFQRTPAGNLRERLLTLATPVVEANGMPDGTREIHLRSAAFMSGPMAQVVVDHRGYLMLANERARQAFKLGSNDLGQLLQDLEFSYQPVELRSSIDQAYRGRLPIRLPEVPWLAPNGETRYLEVSIVPLIDERGGMLGVSISFADLTPQRQLRTELERANQELETAYEELQSANEELETTNEELQSANEELETTNEELQSANEELETMNEELQSTNEELRTMNDQLHQRSGEFDGLNGMFGSILGALRAGAVVLDRSLDIEVWSQRAEDLWGLRSEEVVGTSFLRLDIGVPVDRLMKPLRQALDGGGDQAVELVGVNRRGKPIRCRVSMTPLRGELADGRVLLLMEERSRVANRNADADATQA
jgi:two-component system, chemotaxis family, CheB/CheR fusion protein